MNPDGLILFAHGARDAQWAEPFEAVAGRVRTARPASLVRLAYLEFMTPGLPQAARELIDAGCQSIGVLPLFLGRGGHLKRDLPQIVDGLRAAHPGVRWTLHHAAGEHPALIEAMAVVAVESLGSSTGPAER